MSDEENHAREKFSNLQGVEDILSSPVLDFFDAELLKLKNLRSTIEKANISSLDEFGECLAEQQESPINVEGVIRKWKENASRMVEPDTEIDGWRGTFESMSFVADWQQANISDYVSPEQTEFWKAVLNGDAEKTKALASEKSVDINQRDPKHWVQATALHRASMAGFADVVHVLLTLGSNINLVDRYGETALHYASREHDLTVLGLLLRSHSHPNAPNHFGQTSLHVALDWDAVSPVPYNDSSEEAESERRDRLTSTVRLLLARGADGGAVDKVGISCLHYAARRNHVAAAALLLESGADPNVMTPEGLTPLDVAVATPSPEAAAVLRRGGGRARCNNSITAMREDFPTVMEQRMADYCAVVEVFPRRPARAG